MKYKIIYLVIPIFLLSASCNFFAKKSSAGVVKTVNGGVDWQFVNYIKDDKNLTLNRVNISKLTFSPKNRETVFAGSYSSGLFKSEDSGASWAKILSKISVYDFIFHPQDEKIIYASGSYGGFGKILRTADGGKTWEEIFNEQGEENPVRVMAINYQNPGQMLAGTSSGNLIKSSDGGLSWKLAYNFNERIQRVLWNNNEIFVLTKSKGLYKAVDFAENFQNLSTSISRSLNFNDFSYNRDAVEEFNQMFVDSFNNNLIYLTTKQGLFKTVDQGGNWKKMPLPVKKDDANVRAIAISRSSSNIVYASVGSTIYKTVDGGETFQTQSIATEGLINYILVDPVLPQIAYAGIYIAQ